MSCRAAGGGAFLFWVCGCGSAPTVVGDLHRGDALQTTIVGPYQGVVVDHLGALAISPNGALTPVSCGDLGDLVAGAVITSSAEPSCSPEACNPEVSLAPRSISTGLIATLSNGNPTLQMPNGCTGEYRLVLEAVAGARDPSYLVGDPANPTWILVRKFTGEGGACPSGTTPCADGFIAQNALIR